MPIRLTLLKFEAEILDMSSEEKALELADLKFQLSVIQDAIENAKQ